MLYDAVIVGGGQSAACAAGALRDAGYTGELTIIGDEEYHPYERPPLSKDLLTGRTEIQSTYVRPVPWYKDSNVNICLGARVLKIDRQSKSVLLSTGDHVPYGALLLATGARPRILPGLPPGPTVFYLRTINDTLALRSALTPGKRVAVIGAGFIGSEIAAAARKSKCEVVVFETALHVLARVAPNLIGNYVRQIHEREGVQLHLSCTVKDTRVTNTCEITLRVCSESSSRIA